MQEVPTTQRLISMNALQLAICSEFEGAIDMLDIITDSVEYDIQQIYSDITKTQKRLSMIEKQADGRNSEQEEIYRAWINQKIRLNLTIQNQQEKCHGLLFFVFLNFALLMCLSPLLHHSINQPKLKARFNNHEVSQCNLSELPCRRHGP